MSGHQLAVRTQPPPPLSRPHVDTEITWPRTTQTKPSASCVRHVAVHAAAVMRHYPRESEGLCFYRRWFVCLFVCLSVCYHDN